MKKILREKIGWLLLRLVCLALVAISTEAGLYGQDTSIVLPDNASKMGNDVKSAGWKLTAEQKWEKAVPIYNEDDRKWCLGEFYEKLNLSSIQDLKRQPPEKDLLGLKWSRYYLVSFEDHWEFVDSFGETYMVFQVFYSENKVLSRQLALDQLAVVLRRPHENRNFYKYMEEKDGVQMLVRTVGIEKKQYPVIAEKGGYTLYMQPYTGSISSEEARKLAEVTLNSLTSEQKFGFFPKRALWLQKLRRMSSRERSDWERSVKQKAQSGMAPGGWRNRRSKGDKLAQKLNMEEMIRRIGAREKKEKEWLYPNINSGIGTIAWIRKNMDIPFIPDKGNDETHTNGVTGRFMLQGKDGKIPVRYMIAHLRKQSEALLLLTTLLANQYNDRFDVDKMAEVIRVRPGLVGDYDLCLKPLINELGVPAHGMEHAWIGFVRGGTVVLLKSEDMNASVLELARIIDTALKRNIEAYETPEEIR